MQIESQRGLDPHSTSLDESVSSERLTTVRRRFEDELNDLSGSSKRNSQTFKSLVLNHGVSYATNILLSTCYSIPEFLKVYSIRVFDDPFVLLRPSIISLMRLSSRENENRYE